MQTGEQASVAVPLTGWPARIASSAATRIALLLIVLLAAAVSILASMRNSTTFDEIVFIAGGARGYETGAFDLAPDHPPLMQYIYGLPVWLADPEFPVETATPEQRGSIGYRYAYSKQFFWTVGNDPEQLAFLGRLPAAAMAALLAVLVFRYVRSIQGPAAGLLAAGLVAFLPDVLAHSGVAYSDLPLATAFFASIWQVDNAVRRPDWRNGTLAGIAVGLAFAVKASAIAILPVAALCLLAEASVRYRDAGWWRKLGRTVLISMVVAYVVLVLVYMGDWTLAGLRSAFAFRLRHYTGGHGASAFLLGNYSTTGWWYFFPVSFLYKTSAAFQLLLAVAVLYLLSELRTPKRQLLQAPLRAPILGLIIFGAFLLSSNLNIGFRYALPALPLLAVIAAVGIMRVWARASRAARIALAVCMIWAVAFPISYFPNFLTFVSEYGPPRERNHEVFIDSSLDWGQGLLQLRDWLHERNNPRILLSYFGSGLPEGYDIDYLPVASYLPLHPIVTDTTRPAEYLVVSATNLEGAYIGKEAFASLREVEPYAVIANSLLVYRRLGR
ncbi:MAG: ArnT family glycosyltransferase [Pseudomonas sp.]